MGVRFVLFLSIVFSACTLTRPPELSIQENYRDSLIKKFSVPEIKIRNAEERDQNIDELIYLINSSYFAYEARIYATDGYVDLVSDVVVLGASTAAALVDGGATRTILSAVSAGVTGVRGSIDKNFFQERSKVALVTKMREIRLNKLTQIESMKNLPLADYPWSSAMVDLQEYAESGTLLTALQKIIEEASAGVLQEERELFRLRHDGR